MSDRDAKRNFKSLPITSDRDLSLYLKQQIVNGQLSRREPLYEYDDHRDYNIQPLDNESTSRLLRLKEPIYAQPKNEHELIIQSPIGEEIINTLTADIQNWGYKINDLRVVTRDNGSTLLEMHCVHDPNPIDQITALTETINNPGMVLDGWLLGLWNEFGTPEVNLTPEKVAEIRGVSARCVSDNYEQAKQHVRDDEGVRGTEFYTRHLLTDDDPKEEPENK